MKKLRRQKFERLPKAIWWQFGCQKSESQRNESASQTVRGRVRRIQSFGFGRKMKQVYRDLIITGRKHCGPNAFSTGRKHYGPEALMYRPQALRPYKHFRPAASISALKHCRPAASISALQYCCTGRKHCGPTALLDQSQTLRPYSIVDRPQALRPYSIIDRPQTLRPYKHYRPAASIAALHPNTLNSKL